MIPKHIEEKIIELSKSENTSIQIISESGIRDGYSLAMEELKPILDAAREVLNDNLLFIASGNPLNRFKDYYTMSLDNLSQLIKQYDAGHNNV